jgi:hypothetical protein
VLYEREKGARFESRCCSLSTLLSFHSSNAPRHVSCAFCREVPVHKRLILFVLPCMLLFLAQAHARLVSWYSLEDVAKRAQVLVVGEIVNVATLEPIPPEQSKWPTPLIRAEARVRVLRSFSPKEASRLREGELIAMWATQLDPTKSVTLIDGPLLPDLTPGRIVVLPLRATGNNGASIWELIEEEDLNLVIPAVREPLTAEPVTDALAFLERELAGAFAKGDYATIGKAARFLNSSPTSKNRRADLTPRIRGMVQRVVRRNERRWVTIAAASYGSMGLTSSGPEVQSQQCRSHRSSIRRGKTARLASSPPPLRESTGIRLTRS